VFLRHVTRLGFAIATWAEPDLLVVDEVMAAGDERFQDRSRDPIQD
jgi:ABC-type polysaccharide/polyol phosphate transport system ATPase subunit